MNRHPNLTSAIPSAPARSQPHRQHGIAQDLIDTLPGGPGVYEFYGDGALPLYIGKSVNSRARVLSHIREPAEARMVGQTRRIEWRRTAGEIGALLLESHLIKTRQPLYNRRLRRSRELYSWQFSAEASSMSPALVFSHDVNSASANGLHGLFVSAFAAKEFLRELARQHRLCLTTLGLESASRRGCFGLQLGRCDGACVGREPPARHAERLAAALRCSQVHRWPFPGAVGIVERDGAWTQTHIVRQWRYERTIESADRTCSSNDRPV